jgi:hypothetical protein
VGVRLARLRAGSVTPSPRAGAPGRARGMIRHGTIYALPDLARRAEALHERSVRVMGTVSSYDPEARRARVTMADASLWVDLRRASGADPPRVGSLFQYIGELDAARGAGPDPDEPRPVLRARVARCVDGLDVGVYDIALRERNKWLAS